MVDAGMRCVKYMIFFFNFLFLVSGIAIIVVGSIFLSQIKKYDTVVEGASFTAGAIILVVVGVVVTILAFFACCGAIRENHCMIITYAVLLAIIFILELAAGITCYVYRNDIDSMAADAFNQSWSKYDPQGNPDEAKTINIIQQDLDCCGVNNYTDWFTYKWAQSEKKVPDSCCKVEVPDCGTKVIGSTDKIYTRGCYTEVRNALSGAIIIIAGVGIGVAFIQIVGVILACCLASAIRKNYEVV